MNNSSTSASNDSAGGQMTNAQYASITMITPASMANILAIVIFGRSSGKGAPVVNLFLMCLSCTDLLGCFYAVYTVLAPLYEHNSSAICYIPGFLGPFFGLLSALIAVLLAVDRYFALCKPFKYKTVFSRKRAFRYIISVVIIASVICLLNITGLGSVYYIKDLPDGSQQVVCSNRVYQEKAEQRVFGYLYGIVGSCILVVVIFCNISVIVAVLRMKTNAETIGRVNTPMNSNMQTEVRFARVIAALSLILLVCWGPFMVNALLTEVGVQLGSSYKTASYLLVLLNYIVDPFVFLVLRRSYRREAARLLFGCCCAGKRQGSEDTPNSSKNNVTNQNETELGHI